VNQKKLKHIAHFNQEIDSGAVTDLNDLIQKFPYFSWPFTILAKHYLNNQDYRSESLLHQSALRIHDRNWLYQYLHVQSLEIPQQSPESSFIESKNLEKTTIPNKEKSEHNTDTNTPISEIRPLEPVEPLEQQTVTTEVTELPEQNNSQEVNITLSGENETEAYRPLFTPEIEEFQEESSPQIFPSIPTPVYDLERIFRTESQTTVPDVISGGASQNFYQWLNRTLPEKPQITHTAEKEQQKSLIEQFLITKPSISRPKQEFFKPEKAYKKGEQMTGILVTETLAQIYLKQENPEKAIWAYEQLQLKFPEKKAYFANLIEQIKQEYLKS